MLLSLLLAAQLSLSPEIPVATDALRGSSGAQSQPAIASDGTAFFAAWQTQRSAFATRGDIVGARIGPGGEVLDPNGGIPMQPVWVADVSPSVVWNGETYVLVFASGPHPWPYGVKAVEVTTGGEVITERVLVTPRDISVIEIAWNGSTYLMVWREAGGEVRALRVDRALNVAGDELLLASSGVDAAVASNGVNFMAAWQTPAGAFVSAISSDGVASPAVQLSTAAKTADVASNGVSYAVFGNAEIVGVDAAARVTGRTALPAGVEGAIAWDGLRYVAAWSASERIHVAELDGALSVIRPPARLVREESVQRAPALAANRARTLVLWTDGERVTSDVRGAFIDEPSTSRLVSSGLADQTPADAQWSPRALGVLWHEGDGASASLRLNELTPDGTPLRGSGTPFAPATSARLAWNGETFAIAAARAGRIEVELGSRTIVVGEGNQPWIASDGRDFLVAWSKSPSELVSRIVRRDGTPGEERALPRVTTAPPMIRGVLWHRDSYVVLTLEMGFTSIVPHAVVSTSIARDGTVAAPLTVTRGIGPRLLVYTAMASNGTDILYVVSAHDRGVVARLGLTGPERQIAPRGEIEAVTWDGREFVYAITRGGGSHVLVRGGVTEELPTTEPVVLEGPAVIYTRVLERIPGLADLSVRRAFVRLVHSLPKRRAARH